jgi:alcohol dehydrogenase class IV
MRAFVGEFTCTKLERVISGPGSVDRLGDELDRRGLSRAIIVTGKTLGASTLVQRLTKALGGRCDIVFNEARQHVPAGSVRALIQQAQLRETQCLISFGGGSPIDTAKAAVHALLEPGVDRVIHIAVPTTLSAGEYSAIAGVTDEGTRVKHAVSDPRIAARTVFTDPLMTVETPDWLWIATGMRSLDHAIESSYSVRHHPVSTALGTGAITALVEHLPGSVRREDPDWLDHRAHCQLAAWPAIFGMQNAGFGLSHALGHQIGPRWNVPHGITSCVTLPHTMRFMAEIAADRFGPIAAGLGIPFDAAAPRHAALACADRIERFIAGFNMPMRLRDTGVPETELGDVANIVHGAMERAGVADRPISREEIRGVLQRAY